MPSWFTGSKQVGLYVVTMVIGQKSFYTKNISIFISNHDFYIPHNKVVGGYTGFTKSVHLCFLESFEILSAAYR